MATGMSWLNTAMRDMYLDAAASDAFRYAQLYGKDPMTKTKKKGRPTLQEKLEAAEAHGRERGWYEGREHEKRSYDAAAKEQAQRVLDTKLKIVQAMATCTDALAHGMQAVAGLVDNLGGLR